MRRGLLPRSRSAALKAARSLVVLLFVAIVLTACGSPLVRVAKALPFVRGPAARSPRDLAPGHRFRASSSPCIASPAIFRAGAKAAVAIGCWDGYFYLLDAELNDLTGWPKFSPGGYFSSPAVADLDGDGQDEIVVGSEAGKLQAWSADGRDSPGFPVDLGYHIWAGPMVMPGPRIAIGDRGRMWVFDGLGKAAPGWPQAMQGWPDATAAYAPGLLALTSLTPGDTSRGWLYAWDETGRVESGFPIDLALDTDSSPALADLDGNGQTWVIFGDDGGYLHVIGRDGRERAGFPARTRGPTPDRPTPTPAPPGGNPYSIEASPAVADLDGDGHLEIVAGSWDGSLYVWDDRGATKPGWPLRVADQIISSAALVDLDADGRPDIVAGSKDGSLYGWTPEGKPLPGFPYRLGAPVFSSPWVGDLDDDGRADIVVGANNGIHLLHDVGPLGLAAWPTFHQNAQRRGVAPGSQSSLTNEGAP